MAPRSKPDSSANLVKIISFVVIVVGIAAGAYFFLLRGSSTAPKPATTTAPTATTAAPAAGTPAAAPAPQPVPDLTPEQLSKEASAALRENRLVAPPGNNALEYYLSLLDKQPNNATARDALREMFPIAVGPVEQSINSGNLDEATRVINLLAKFDANNYSLTILRTKLDAKKKQVDREEAQKTAEAAKAEAAQKAAAAAAANAAAERNAAATSAPSEAATTAAAPKPTVSAPPPAVTPVAPPPVASAPTGESHPAEILKTSPPDYPPDAVRRRQEGWVEVEFTVTPDGQITDANVINANPARVFNASAIRAVQRWSFKPKVENGKAVAERMRRRIEFKLGG